MANLVANGMPNPSGFFLGLAQAPLHFHNAVAELVDNAIAACAAKSFDIKVDVSPQGLDTYIVTVSDNGPGIGQSQLTKRVFRTGEPPLPGSPSLNEHGFGLKNVLAKIEKLNGEWWIMTRDPKALSKGRFLEARSPLKFRIPILVQPQTKWPRYASPKTGTVVRLVIPLSFMQTVGWGRRGRPPKTIDKILKVLSEHLGVFYRGYLVSLS